MDVHFEDFRANQHTVEVGVDDTAEDMRRKVASAMGLPEDSFCMSFGDEAMGEGYDMTQLGETDLTIKRLKEVKDPEVACLLLQAEVTTVIPDWFLSQTSLTRLDLSAVSFVTQIGDEFLWNCALLTSIDLSGLSNVTRIGESFLSGCEALANLDLTPLNNVTKIEACFLESYKSLTTLDLTPLSNVTLIERSFLFDCTSIPSLDVSPLSKVKKVGKFFAEDCTSLTSIYLSGCSSAVSKQVRKSKELKQLVVEERPKRSRDESPKQARKRQCHVQ